MLTVDNINLDPLRVENIYCFYRAWTDMEDQYSVSADFQFE